MTGTVLPPSIAPRLLNKKQAAEYFSLSIGTFDKMVSEGVLPKPYRLGKRQVWDRKVIDHTIDEWSSQSSDAAQSHSTESPFQARIRANRGKP